MPERDDGETYSNIHGTMQIGGRLDDTGRPINRTFSVRRFLGAAADCLPRFPLEVTTLQSSRSRLSSPRTGISNCNSFSLLFLSFIERIGAVVPIRLVGRTQQSLDPEKLILETFRCAA
jgi:hypothetical protein